MASHTITQTMNRILIFDVETTGLLKKDEPSPYITQLSFLVYDRASQSVKDSFAHYIRIPDEVVIPPIVTELTGITRATCDEQGVPIVEALVAFYRAYVSCDTIVAHNLKFDQQMMCEELVRNYSAMVDALDDWDEPSVIFNELYNRVHGKQLYCTMLAGIDVCNLWTSTAGASAPRKYKKYPKLSELHQALFGSVPEGLHDATVDTEACLNCFLRLEPFGRAQGKDHDGGNHSG